MISKPNPFIKNRLKQTTVVKLPLETVSKDSTPKQPILKKNPTQNKNRKTLLNNKVNLNRYEKKHPIHYS
jgi:hypothetical protein